MATIFLVEFPRSEENKSKHFVYASSSIQRWGERQNGAAFVSVDNRFIITDYPFEHKEIGLLRHILNCNNLSYRCVTNVDLDEMGDNVYARAINRTHNNNTKN